MLSLQSRGILVSGNIHVIPAADQLHNNREQISSIHAFPDCLWHFIHLGRPLLCVRMDGVYIHIGFTVLKGLGTMLLSIHDDVIKWKHYPRYCPFVRGIPRSPVNSTQKGQWRRGFVFSLICAWRNGWVKIVMPMIWDTNALIMTSLS